MRSREILFTEFDLCFQLLRILLVLIDDQIYAIEPDFVFMDKRKVLSFFGHLIYLAGLNEHGVIWFVTGFKTYFVGRILFLLLGHFLT